ncbi:MAG: adenylosuccinate synthase [Dictyoglomus sp.]|nr:adenylosuccinate synthase [Dictyoglomus sp.]MCX7942717.1 adenylosuccinate synthase [Dictyoglomaceae bacterium]MDW8189269.1 adenylosuccinate synthase [Dictyoglomus sp.]
MKSYNTLVIIGAQWGDEGKGKIIDWIAQKAEAVVRFNGGNNAGHTVVVNGKTFKFRLLPSGVISEKTINIIANGVVVNLLALLEEIKEVEALGIKIKKLYISNQASLILPYHINLDKLIEEKKGHKKIGTTGRGIGPAYSDKVSREALFVGDLLDKESFKEKLKDIYHLKETMLKNSFILPPFEEIYNSQYEALEEILKRDVEIINTPLLINNLILKGAKILFEGANGTLLDINFGTYPYVTSSHTISGGVCIGAGISPDKINKIIGVVKAYTSRVGEGPFPSEIHGKLADYIREKGQEYGTVTRRPRRVGWLDLVALRYAHMINGFSFIALTKLDVLSGLEEIKVVKGYRFKGKIIEEFPVLSHQISQCEPVLESLTGWKEDLKGIKELSRLPLNAQKYIEFIEKELNVKISIIGTGDKREELIVIKDPWE